MAFGATADLKSITLLTLRRFYEVNLDSNVRKSVNVANALSTKRLLMLSTVPKSTDRGT